MKREIASLNMQLQQAHTVVKEKTGSDPVLGFNAPGGPVVSPEPLGVLGARDADGRAAVESTQEEASWSKNGTT